MICMNVARRLPLLFVAFLLVLTSTAALAASSKAHKRTVDDNDTVPIHGNVHPNARPEFDQGPEDASVVYEKMVLVLRPRAGAKDNVDRLLAQLHDPSSAQYQQWLTPEQFGKRFGVGDDELADVTGCVTRDGFTIREV